MQHNAMARTQEVFKSFTLKFQQSNKCLWWNKRGRTKEEKHQELQDQDLLGSPHLEERWIGGNVDLDLLSLSLKDMQESWEGLRGGKLSKVNNGGREKGKRAWKKLGYFGEEGGVFIPPQKYGRWSRKRQPDIPVQT